MKINRPIFVCGLLLGILTLLAACSSTPTSSSTGSSSGQAPTQVTVGLSEYAIQSSQTTFTPGKAYHFVVTNNGNTAHEFMIMPNAMGTMGNMDMRSMDKMALAAIDTVNPGQTKTLDYTFPASTQGSHPQFACYLPGHYEAGMKQDVAVQ